MARAGGEEWKAAAMAPAAAPAVVRPKPSFADCVFRFCMKSSIVLGLLYFLILCFIAATNPQLEKLWLLPFFGVAVTVPFYAASLLQEFST